MSINIDSIILYGYTTPPQDDSTQPCLCDFQQGVCGETIHVPYIALKDSSAIIALIKQQAIANDEEEPEIDLLCCCTTHMTDLRDTPRSIVGHPQIEFELRRLGVR